MRRPLIASLALLGLLSGCGSSATTTRSQTPPAAPPTTVTTATATTTTTSAPPAKPKPKPKPKSKPKPNPGSLPQTHQLPPATSPGFQAEMAALWAGVKANSVTRAMPAFFPEAAYAQVKAIADPGADYTDRLVGDLRLDLGAAHALLGPDAGSARLVAVRVPESYAHWIDPGVCANGIGYYELPNARVVYRQGGQVHSFGIASMISWRGVWYVVHLGAVVRPAAAGMVDDPSAGAGESVPSSTC